MGFTRIGPCVRKRTAIIKLRQLPSDKGAQEERGRLSRQWEHRGTDAVGEDALNIPCSGAFG